ncbi:MAG: hypothetical protein COU81_03620 [Candidatus Portnoybacteria bacterium CG10_big_fil_rev_8_21_14_0_10_36_7]|uniref:dolichyl-phosphate beta-glucosyltransferase n=1 Tax=Candidatus Portnoybacteria bacterium CG10_big_fil_rev_8_21_14_0_10_36_7 TaxID=1974812 RepID=A0A2M8KD99_9BACT|nr:MAG: hypothetical protein COU81_03620 [Candidatus Portnoybacteria bacterium CG10_big_fil_rev_8_21_14_0_10_36_7]
MDYYLSVIIPAYNEEKRIAKTLIALSDWLSSQTYSYEIIVVSDGAKDNTTQVVKGLQEQISNLRVIDNKGNHGKGFVVRQGMLEAKGEYRVFMDADNSTSIDHFSKMDPFFKEGFDIVIGSRDIKGADIKKHQARYKEFLGDAGNIFIQVVAGLFGIWDTQCGFKCFSAKAAEDVFSRMRIDRWGFDIEALAISKKLGYKIKQIPVTWINDEESHVKLFAYFEVIWETIKIRWNLIIGKYNK